MKPPHSASPVLAVGIGLLLAPVGASAKTVVVPDDAPNLAIALNPASGLVDPGDTIELTDGSNYAQAYTVTIPDLTIVGAAGQNIVIDPFNTGPGFYVDLSSPGMFRVENLTIQNGRGSVALGYQDGGGGIRTIANVTDLHVVDCTITNCSAVGLGGGIYVSGHPLTVDHCTFSSNSADAGLGGAIRGLDAHVEIRNGCTFTGNQAFSPTSGKGGGVGLSGDASSLLIDDATFTANYADASGGAVYTGNRTDSVVITNSAFATNDASGFASADTGGVLCSQAEVFFMDSCSFDGNTCAGQGGALRLSDVSNATIVGCTFENNACSNAAASLLITATATFYNCTFWANDATQPGDGDGQAGAVEANGESNAALVNCLFFDNSAILGGACASRNGSDLTLTNCTFAENAAITPNSGALVVAGNADCVVENSVIWGNTPATDPIVGVATVRSCVVEGGYPSGTNITATDPLFTDAPNDDFSISAGSPAIDAGENARYSVLLGPGSDLAGNLRLLDDPATADTGIAIIGPVIDLGCYEFGAVSTPSACAGDLDGDNDTDIFDFGIFASDFMCQGGN